MRVVHEIADIPKKDYPCINDVVRQLIIWETVTFDSTFDHRQKFDTQQFFYP